VYEQVLDVAFEFLPAFLLSSQRIPWLCKSAAKESFWEFTELRNCSATVLEDSTRVLPKMLLARENSPDVKQKSYLADRGKRSSCWQPPWTWRMYWSSWNRSRDNSLRVLLLGTAFFFFIRMEQLLRGMKKWQQPRRWWDGCYTSS
jgi:hypothetical protein